MRVERDLWRSSSLISAQSRSSCRKLLRDASHRVLNISKDSNSTVFLSNLCQCLATSRMKYFSIYLKWFMKYFAAKKQLLINSIKALAPD